MEIVQENSKGSVKQQTLWESLSVTNPLFPISYMYLPACCSVTFVYFCSFYIVLRKLRLTCINNKQNVHFSHLKHWQCSISQFSRKNTWGFLTPKPREALVQRNCLERNVKQMQIKGSDGVYVRLFHRSAALVEQNQ